MANTRPEIVSPDQRDPTRGDSEPNRCWTLTNMSEATPDIMSPMCWSLWTPLGEMAGRRMWNAFGLLPKRMLHQPMDSNNLLIAPFYGRQAINVDRVATLMSALPGTSRQDFERDFLGTVRTETPEDEAPRRRLPFIAAKLPFAIARQQSLVEELYCDQSGWWQHDVLEGPVGSSRALLTAARDRFESSMYLHSRSRMLSQVLQGAISKLSESVGRADLVTEVCAAFGQVAETSIAEDLWAMSRGEIKESEFVRRHGFHGCNEGNVTGIPWRLDPKPMRSLAAAMARRPDGDRPRLREQAAMERRRVAEQELMDILSWRQRRVCRFLLRLARTQVRCQEQTKSSFLMAIDGVREATRFLGTELAGEGKLANPDDAVFLTLSELLGTLPSDSNELASFRRSRRDEYRRLTLPTTFVGMPQPLEAVAAEGPTDIVTGAPGSAGTAEGPARVVSNLDESSQLVEGEILVCRYTDPAWAAAISLAAALVIDIGAPSSHGAIVARELGVPCVIGTATGTTQIRSGDRLRVDGRRGQVDILSRAEPVA